MAVWKPVLEYAGLRGGKNDAKKEQKRPYRVIAADGGTLMSRLHCIIVYNMFLFAATLLSTSNC